MEVWVTWSSDRAVRFQSRLPSSALLRNITILIIKHVFPRTFAKQMELLSHKSILTRLTSSSEPKPNTLIFRMQTVIALPKDTKCEISTYLAIGVSRQQLRVLAVNCPSQTPQAELILFAFLTNTFGYLDK